MPKESVFLWLLVASTLLTMSFFIGDFFSVYYDFDSNKFIYQDARRVFLRSSILQVFGITTFLLVLLLLMSMRGFVLSYKPSHLVLFLCFSLIVLTWAFDSAVRPMLFFGLACTVFFLDFFRHYLKVNRQENIGENILYGTVTGRFLIILLSSYLVIPLIVYIFHLVITGSLYFQIEFAPQLYIYDSFRGLTLDRIQYSFLAGLLLLVLLSSRSRNWYYLIPFLIFGLYLAQSRAVFLALAVAVIIFYASELRLFVKGVLFIIFLLIIMMVLGFREDFFVDGGNRLELLMNSIDQVLVNGWLSVLFGSGEFYTLGIDGHQPHNSILQTMLNFGLIVTVLWLLVLYRFYLVLSKDSKVLFIYVMIFGLFHVGFSAFVFMPMTFMSYMYILALTYPKPERVNT